MSRVPLQASPLALLACIVAAVPVTAAESPRCAALANSPLAEPEWYAEECLGIAPRSADEPVSGLAPGDPQFILNIRNAAPNPRSLVTAPVPTLTYTLVGALPAQPTIFAMDFDNAANTLWAIDSRCIAPNPCVGRDYGTFNQTTGAFTVVGQITGPAAGVNFSGMKFDPTTGTVYLSVIGTVSELWTLNLTTGAATLVGPITGFALIIDIAIDNSGQIYGHDIGVDQIVRIDKTTGAPTVVGSTGQNANFAQGMDFDASTNTLYAYMYLGGGANNLSTINLATGQATILVPGVAGPENEGAIKAAVTVSIEPAALSVDSTGNNVLEPNETNVRVAPSWRNPNSSVVNGVAGTLANFTGPAGPAYLINDSAAAYGNIAANATQSCGADCYAVTITAATRPATHWDSTANETVTPTSPAVKTWILHVGNSFSDVSGGPFYRFIETLLHRGVTGGCTATTYCPANSTTRDQMAVFVLVAREGPAYVPPACVAGAEDFADVPASNPFCRWIEELATRGVVAGCGGGNYCPTNPVTREQMSIFVLRTLDPTLNPPACVAGAEDFADVPASSPFCRWIEELVSRGVVTGCGGGNYCPLASVTRDQMGVFISVTFGLTLYGV